jgi:hypothetical protein
MEQRQREDAHDTKLYGRTLFPAPKLHLLSAFNTWPMIIYFSINRKSTFNTWKGSMYFCRELQWQI